MKNNFADRLNNAIKTAQTPLIVGLDPRAERLPAPLKGLAKSDPAAAYEKFCKEIIDVVAKKVPAVKPQAAFFEQLGPGGCVALGKVVQHARENGLKVIMDAKRGDIGSTAEAYAAAYLGEQSPWSCDALTINPYLGADTIEPFVKAAKANGAGLFTLVKTSNPGSKTIQDLECDGETVYQKVAAMVQELSADTVGDSGYGIVGAVVGATYPEQLAELRAKMPNTILLIPGFGAQGGTASDVAAGFSEDGLGAVVNSSRGIIFAYENDEYSGKAEWQTSIELATHAAIEQLRTDTPAGKLATN